MKKTRIIAIIVILCLCFGFLVGCAADTVSFETNGGNKIEKRKLNEDFTMPDNPTKTDYVFIGWFLDRGLTKPFEFTSTADIESSITLYASWVKAKNTVTLDYQQATGGNSVTTKEVNYGEEYTLPVPTRTGYTFDGWFTQAEGGIRYTNNQGESGESRIDADITLYAHWQVVVTSITYNYDDKGTATQQPQTATWGQSFALGAPTPLSDDYVFIGWFTQATGGNSITDALGNGQGNWAQETASIVLYAQWEDYSTTACATPDATKAIYGEGVLYWQSVPRAIGYVVTMNNVQYETTDPCVVLPMIPQGEYTTITIVAKNKNSQFNSQPASVNIYRPLDSELEIAEISISGTSFGTRTTNAMEGMAQGTPANAVSFDKVYTIVTGKTLSLTAYNEAEGITILYQEGSEVTVEGNTLTIGNKEGVAIISGKLNATNEREIRIIRVTTDTLLFAMGDSYNLRDNTIANLDETGRINYLDKEVKSYTVGTKNVFIPDLKMSSNFVLNYTLKVSEYSNNAWSTFTDAALSDYAFEVDGNIQFLPAAEGKRFELTVSSRYKKGATPKYFTIEVNDGYNVYTQEQLQEYFSNLNVTKVNLLRNLELSLPKNADYYFYSYEHDTDGVYEYGTPETTPELYFSKAGCVLGMILTEHAIPAGVEVIWDEHGFAAPITHADFSSLYDTTSFNAAPWLDRITFYSIDPLALDKTPKAVSAYGTQAKDIKIDELRTLFFYVFSGADQNNIRDGKNYDAELINWRAGALKVDYTFANGSTEPIKASGVLFDKDGNDITDLVANINGNHLLEEEDFVTYESGYVDNPDRPVIYRNAPYCHNEIFVRTNFWVTSYNPLYNNKLEFYGNYLSIDGSELPLHHVYALIEGSGMTQYTSNTQGYAAEGLNVPMHMMFEALFGIFGNMDNDIDYADDFESFEWKNEGLQVEINDLTLMANDARPSGLGEDGNPIEDINYYADKGYSNYRVDKARLTLDNCIAQNSVINVVVQEGHVTVKKSLLYNTFDWNFYVMLRSLVRCEDSYIGFSGGAALGMQNYLGISRDAEPMHAGAKYYSTLIELHDTYLSNWVTGSETWFSVYNLATSATLIKATLDDNVRRFSGGSRYVTVVDDNEVEFFNFAMLGFTTNGNTQYDMYNVIIETTDDDGVVHVYDMVRPGHDYFLGLGDPRIADNMFMAPVGKYSQTDAFVKYAGADIQATVQAGLTDYAADGVLTATYTPAQLVIINTLLAEINAATYTADAAGATAFVQDYAIQRHTFGKKDVAGILTTYLTTGNITDADVITAYHKACLGNTATIANPQFAQAFAADSANGCVLGEIAVALGTYQLAPATLTARQTEIVQTYSSLGGDITQTVTYFAMKDSFTDSAQYYELGDTDGTTLVEVKGGMLSFRFTMYVWHYNTAEEPEIELISFGD